MAETGAIFGGEHSGHYYFRDNFRADSGIIAALVVLEALSKAGVPLSELRVPFERYSDSGEINTEVPDPVKLIGQVAEHYRAEGAEIDDLDGITVELGDWWFNLRPSNTEPLLRLNLEARDRCRARPPPRRGARPDPPPCGQPRHDDQSVMTTKGAHDAARSATARPARLS